MADQESPATLHLVLVPKTNEAGEIVTLHFSITIQDLHLKEDDFLCTYNQNNRVHLSRLQHYLQGIPATIRDTEGPVPFDLTGDNGGEVRITRGLVGDLVFASDVQALGGGEDEVAHREDPSALRRDRGGVIGAGRYFLPSFDFDACRMLVAWDLSGCPAGTAAMTSFSEGPDPVEILGGSDALLDCVFMAGPELGRFPTPPADAAPDQQHAMGGAGAGAGAGATYWFGELPENLSSLRDYTANIFPRMAEHFADQESSYRMFLRRTPQGLGGTAFGASGIIDYDDDARDEEDWDLVRVLNRTMVSAWARLDRGDDGTENDWFTQGLAHLYTVFLPFRFSQRGPDYFRATVNAFLSAYFTNPLVARPLAELTAPLLQDWHAASARATRAFVYMLKMDAYTRRAAVARGAEVLRPMDEVVRALLTRRRGGERVGKEEWLEDIGYWLGREEAGRHFHEMVEGGGRVNELDDMVSSFGKTYGPQLVEQEVLEFGFGRESLQDSKVRGVVEGSRAWEAGLRDGQSILWYSRPEACEVHYERRFKLVVERDGDKVDVEYWPRSREKVRCWQVLERPQAGGEDGNS